MQVRRQRGAGWWHLRFNGCGYRMTVPRQSILDVLSRTSEHLSAEEVYMAVHKVYPNVGLTTIYRTLELLVNMGMVFKFDFGDGRARYELNYGSEDKKYNHHHHLVCINCQKVIDYVDFIDDEVELLKKTERGLSKKYNFKIMKHILQFYGLCKECQEKQK